MRSSTAEESVIDMVETINGPRLRAGADGTVDLFWTEVDGTKEATLPVKDQKSLTERWTTNSFGFGQQEFDGLHGLKRADYSWN